MREAPPRHDELLSQNAEINALLLQQAELNLTALHRPIERFSRLVSRPAFIVGALGLAALWISVNLVMKAEGRAPWDEPPFYWLQGVLALLSLLITMTVLIGQSRQGELAEQRAQLQLQVVLLTEQRTAKLIALLEELRHDLPNVADRVDEEAEVLQHATNPEMILHTLNDGEDVPGAVREQRDP
ncbi:DUF1003 domain-containing protein [Deinococcus maricopensis]|uniref:DUF1003 domain-containing protein n=1 Tax=Deinococcus maricopensis (strain DSM 21211 / LMG 22137 / NRRL B-23946 / LB-34) TaxID=709986 RepID=E8U5V2_DEIML|nr:DUF1003 domain-containing protein [Deinococcus maricopensis]ADV66441.1 hypothetical protein Deima_0785 [Deinococcus maricopensis DSM 21211]